MSDPFAVRTVLSPKQIELDGVTVTLGNESTVINTVSCPIQLFCSNV